MMSVALMDVVKVETMVVLSAAAMAVLLVA